MGRSFDRGGRSRKERESGKRRAFQQAERDREARQAVIQAKRTQAMVVRQRQMASAASVEDVSPAIAMVPGMMAPAPVAVRETAQPPKPDIPVTAATERKSGFVAQVFRRLFKKSA